MKNVFNKTDADEFITRINRLNPDTKPLWGVMTAPQMLSHCNVTYELIYENKHPKPNRFMRFLISLMAKSTVVGDKPYQRNLPTAPIFKVNTNKNFEEEKARLIGYINRTQQLGAAHFNGKESHSFGVLNESQWNKMMSKHLDHHLTQFGV